VSLTQVTVVCTYITPGSANPTGTVEFAPYPPFRNTGSNITVSGSATGTLVAGTCTLVLYATDDADTVACDVDPDLTVRYKVTERITGVGENSWMVELPNSPTSVQLADLPPA
jgi:hypothetical protein